MGSKRDALKRLRDGAVPAATERETPAEEYSLAAAQPEKEQPVQTKEAPREREDIPTPVANPPTTTVPQMEKRISFSLRIQNKNWMHRTAIRCGYSIQEYINLLVQEAWIREQEIPYVYDEGSPLPERIPSKDTVLVAIKVGEDDLSHLRQMKAARGMTLTFFMNELIEQERERENRQGMRHSVFDV